MSSRPSPLKVAAVQYEVTGGLGFSQFIDKIASQTQAAAREGADLVIFPELFSMDLFRSHAKGGSIESEREDIQRIVTEEAPGFFTAIEKLSTDLGVAIQAGTMPRRAPEYDAKNGAKNGGPAIVNTAMLAIPGSKPAFQDKVFLTSCEKEWGWTPGSRLKVIEAPWGRTVIAICFDIEFPSLSAQLAASAPELILVPSCTGAIYGFQRVRWTAQARAIEHYAFVVHTGTVGRGTGSPSMDCNYGQAAILTPSDSILADTAGYDGILSRGPLNEAAIVYGELDFAKLRRARKHTTVWPARDQLARNENPS